ncbi:MAG: hypothetical protein ACFE9D_05985 [Promethearchaeota archaeon]
MTMTIITELQDIEKRLDQEGDTAQVRKVFWRIVGKIKRLDPALVDDKVVEKATAIRNRLFKHKIAISVGRGVAVYFLVFLLSILGYIWALLFLESTLAVFIILPPLFAQIILNIVLILICVCTAYGFYPMGRFLGGVIARVKFEGMYRYSPGELGLKIEYASYLRTTPSRRKWVFGFPIIWVFGILITLLPITWLLNPTGVWAPIFIIILFALFYVVIYRMKTGEIYRFVRELRIAREVKRTQ